MAVLICYCGVVVPPEIAFEASMKEAFGDRGWDVWGVFNRAPSRMQSRSDASGGAYGGAYGGAVAHVYILR